MYTRENLIGKTLICSRISGKEEYLIGAPENGKSDYVSLIPEKPGLPLNNYEIQIIERCVEIDRIWKVIDNTYQIY